MSSKPIFCKTDVPLGAILVCQLAKVPFEWGEKTQFPLDSCVSLSSSSTISRHVARLHPALDLYPANLLHRTEVDHWLTVSCGPLGTKKDISAALNELNNALAPSPFLAAEQLTIADIEVFASLFKSQDWQDLKSKNTCPPHVLRWYNHVLTKVDSILSSLPAEILSSVSSKQKEHSVSKREDGGKFVELPGAKMGEVVVRFPPEASGYLHIGHAKAALLNQYYQKAFMGKLIMRFDDTNPDKEKADFEKVIIEDLKLLEVFADIFSFTSDYFDQMLEMCELLLRNGKAYVDDTDAETMKNEREERKESKNRNNSVETNLKMWIEMKAGSELGQKCCVRAKIDMNSSNGCMRDPTIYRCKNEPHLRTGSKFKVYPTYDFACPIVDSVEGVTHALRTTEYHDRDEQFFWFIKNLNLRPVHIYEYSRLNMNNTVLSKRKLTWFVNEGLVDGWDDPRFPTVRGILRKGMTIEGLRDFIVAQGSSRSVVNMEWDKIWAFNKKVIDREASRFTALQGNLVPVFVQDAKEELKEAQRHPKDPSKGMKTICLGPKVYIESIDAAELREGENATFINWGNLKILKVHKKDEQIEKVEAETNLSNTDFKKTLKLTWLAESSKAPWTPIVCSFFGHLISKSVLGKDEDFKNFINSSTRSDIQMVGDCDLKYLKPGDIIQLQRKGFFRVDKAYEPFSAASCKETPVALFYIPDGHTKEQNIVPSNGEALSDKELKHTRKGKQVEKSPQEEIKSIVGGNKSLQIHEKIKEQGDKIRKLKSDKADKSAIMTEVEVLKALKSDFKAEIGTEWIPDIDINKFIPADSKPTEPVTSKQDEGALKIHQKIIDQGDKVRKLKSEKASKEAITAEVNALLSLKKDFKNIANLDWKPDIDSALFTPIDFKPAEPIGTPKQDEGALKIHQKIIDQGDKVRKLKSEKASKEAITTEVNVLLSLKKDFKNITNLDWKPDIDPTLFTPIDSKPAELISSPKQDEGALKIHQKIIDQGDKVRKLKSEKASKEAITTEVNVLLSLKKDFKNITNLDWKPDIDPTLFAESKIDKPSAPLGGAMEVHQKIKEQGDKIRKFKSEKAVKDIITSEINKLLELKKDFKNLTNIDWKPDIDPVSFLSVKPTESKVVSQPETALDIHQKIKDHGDKVRKLKSDKASKDNVTAAVNILLELKKDFKNLTNIDWKPDIDPASFSVLKPELKISGKQDDSVIQVHQRIIKQGDKVRQLKSSKADKEAITAEVNILLELKKEFKSLANVDWKPDIEISSVLASKPASNETKINHAQKPESAVKVKKPKLESKVEEKDKSGKKQTRLGLEAKKSGNFSDWYSQVITKSEMIEYYNVSGCYILRPWSYSIWELIKDFFDKEIKALGVKNAYFPIFVSKDALEKEKTHIADFSPEVAWVTRSGSSEMAEPVAIRPTSETVMYPAFAKWIQSHRDLPIKINQWNNVVRWEFKQPTPFLRTREFLWQEGHTAFATKEEACDEVYKILELYARIYEELLAIPVVRGHKTKKEQFAGGDFTTTTEAYISASGRAIQGATSHHLGQNFSKMFEIVFEDPETREKKFVYQNSWGLTTRSIGVMVMVHGDDKGLVLPPRVAPIQTIIIPVGITASTTEEGKQELYKFCSELEGELTNKGITAQCDFDDHITPGWKFNHWELKGVPLRIEIGPKELTENKVFAVRRDNGEKQSLDRMFIERRVFNLLETIHNDMFSRAKEELCSHKAQVHQWADFVSILDNGNLLLAPFCGVEECEDDIKKNSAKNEPSEAGAPSMGAKGLCIPFEQPGKVDDLKCINPNCQRAPKFYTLFGRSY